MNQDQRGKHMRKQVGKTSPKPSEPYLAGLWREIRELLAEMCSDWWGRLILALLVTAAIGVGVLLAEAIKKPAIGQQPSEWPKSGMGIGVARFINENTRF